MSARGKTENLKRAAPMPRKRKRSFKTGGEDLGNHRGSKTEFPLPVECYCRKVCSVALIETESTSERSPIHNVLFFPAHLERFTCWRFCLLPLPLLLLPGTGSTCNCRFWNRARLPLSSFLLVTTLQSSFLLLRFGAHTAWTKSSLSP